MTSCSPTEMIFHSRPPSPGLKHLTNAVIWCYFNLLPGKKLKNKIKWTFSTVPGLILTLRWPPPLSHTHTHTRAHTHTHTHTRMLLFVQLSIPSAPSPPVIFLIPRMLQQAAAAAAGAFRHILCKTNSFLLYEHLKQTNSLEIHNLLPFCSLWYFI